MTKQPLKKAREKLKARLHKELAHMSQQDRNIIITQACNKLRYEHLKEVYKRNSKDGRRAVESRINNKKFHYVYRMDFNDGTYYIGKHSSNIPSEYDLVHIYKSSSKHVVHRIDTGDVPTAAPVLFTKKSQQATKEEATLIRQCINDPKCLNRSCPGMSGTKQWVGQELKPKKWFVKHQNRIKAGTDKTRNELRDKIRNAIRINRLKSKTV